MNHLHRQKLFSAVAKWLCVLLALLALPQNAPAQPTTSQRWLFIFDLSSTMKKQLPATEEVLKNFFGSGAEGRLQDGDNLGVWTYDQKTHGGQFPLVIWKPEQVTTMATNLIAFLRSRTYTASSKLAALQPALTGVITNSERLTIVIFCDGESDLTATPYDSGINQSFLDGRAERKKNLQPFVVLIRTLSGKYIGCTVNFPPGTINIPLFLSPAPPPNIPPPVVVVPVKPPPAVVPDLVIVGTRVATNSAPEIPSPATNAVAVAVAVAAPKIIAAAAPPPTPVLPVVSYTAPPPTAEVEMPVVPAVTNPATAIVKNDSDSGLRRLVLVGGGLLAAAIVLVIILIRRGRRPESSLITSSMQDDPRRK